MNHTCKILRYFFLLLLMAAGAATSVGQIPIKYTMTRQTAPDSLDTQYYGRRHFWRASAEVVGFNLGLWAFDRYVQHGDFSYISWKTIRDNFREGFKWDNDKLGTNTFLHPYNGNLYYNAARSNGFNFWQSELFAIFGSGMWEMFMECEYPSTNDIIATPVGGAAIGEVLFRASDALVDDRAVGSDRFSRELGIFLLSPMRGINRIVTGDAWRHRTTSGRVCGVPNIALRVSLGMKMMELMGHTSRPFVGATAQIDLEYGDRFEPRSSLPYDYFSVKAVLQGMKYQPVLNQLQIKGRLLSREIIDRPHSSASVGLYQHFDFYDSDTITNIEKVPYKLGIPASLGCGVMYRSNHERNFVLDAYLHANGILLGGILSDHYYADERAYNWASGFSLKAGLNLILRKDLASISITDDYYRMFTWSGYHRGTDLSKVNFRTLNAMGDKSVAFFNVLEARLDFKIWQKLYGTLSFISHTRSTHYRDFPDYNSSTCSLQLMATYKF